MTTQLYDLTVPVFLRGFHAMSGFLAKGEAFAAEKGIDPAELLTARLFEDMAPLTGQVQRVSDGTRFCLVRLGGVENVPMPDEEASFADLQDRIAKTVAFLKSVPREAIDGKEEAKIELKLPNRTLEFTGSSYVLGFALPNFYFHVTTAYAILRHKGVPIGKMDFLGGA
ncbi:MAG: hypothetical protein JWN66_1825 [Sphingomonas bacterium]|uniref:DUF1993 domain-containing protein n=1 Tax=Sphingomonas bacterium TaxID=1895847 RepID=UPI002604F6DD|nr:DUF1993 domain-containing protein [Sphingomonas bacterium]MDB5704709.1 hypothetical protein [Sphingomonas bacterium]